MSAGLAAFAQRIAARCSNASFKQVTEPVLRDDELTLFSQHPSAWDHYEASPPSYCRNVTWWVVSAKRVDTRSQPPARLIEACTLNKRF